MSNRCYFPPCFAHPKNQAWFSTSKGLQNYEMFQIQKSLRNKSVNLASETKHYQYSWHLCIWLFHLSNSQFSRSIVSDSLQPCESQHARPPCPSPTPGVHSESCSSSQWRHPAISSSIVPFSSCHQTLPASKSFPMSQLFTWGGQSTGVSALASFFFKEIPWLISFRMDWLDLLAAQWTLKSLLQRHSSNASILCHSAFFRVQLSHPYMTTGKP